MGTVKGWLFGLSLALSCGLAPAICSAADATGGWNWYSVIISRNVAFGADKSLPVGVRFGTAKVMVDRGNVQIELRELGGLIVTARFSGAVSVEGRITGSLSGFEPDEPNQVAWVGAYHEESVPCSPQMMKSVFVEKEIVLRPVYELQGHRVYPNGRVLVLVNQKPQDVCSPRANK